MSNSGADSGAAELVLPRAAAVKCDGCAPDARLAQELLHSMARGQTAVGRDGGEPVANCRIICRGVGDLQRRTVGDTSRRLDAQPATPILAVRRMQHRSDQ